MIDLWHKTSFWISKAYEETRILRVYKHASEVNISFWKYINTQWNWNLLDIHEYKYLNKLTPDPWKNERNTMNK